MRSFAMRAVLCLWSIYLGTVLLSATSAAAVPDFEALRQAMVMVIEDYTRDMGGHLGKDGLDRRVVEVMAEVPRHQFVPDALRDYAYQDRPLPIGYGQTISQPFMVALMTDLVGLKPDDVVLEVGTGSGYQAAVFARLAGKVYTLEIIAALGKEAEERLKRLGFGNCEVRIGDGYYGWKDHAPFDAIVVTAAASHIPPPLIRQLKPGGRMVIPVGSHFLIQHLMLVEKAEDGTVTSRELIPVAFVPLTGRH
jgi:protein-L-isoaspartate(D-aspartate) O-methyltransferase